jgi:hypothetical protein
MGIEDQEVDYLVRAQLPHDPDSFRAAVQEAFLLEHDCLQNQDIAEVLGKEKSRVSQIFGDPENLKASTVRNLLDHLKSRRHKRRILRAWIKDALGIDIEEKPSGRLVREVSEKTLGRVDRQIRQMRLDAASQTSIEAAFAATDPILREQLLDRAYFVRQRLDLAGRAMWVARLIAEGDLAKREPRRLATAHYFKVRILVGLPDTNPADVEPILERIDEIIAHAPPPPAEAPYCLVTGEILETARMGFLLTFAERKMLEVGRVDLKRLLERVQERLKRKGLSYQDRFHQHLVAGRIYLLLGDTFQAEEHIEKAYSSGKLKNLNSLEMCGLVQARIMRVTDDSEKVRDYLRDLGNNCARSLDLYHRRIAEYDLARVEGDLFPA